MADNGGTISPLEDFVLAPKPDGMALVSKAALAKLLHERNPDSTNEATLASDISQYFIYARPLQERFKDLLRALAGRPLREQVHKAIERHEEEYARRRDPIGVIRNRFSDSDRMIFIGLEPISANLGIAPSALVEVLRHSLRETMNGQLAVTMCVPTEDMAHTIWRAVSTNVQEWATANRSNLAEAKEHIDSRMTVMLLPRRLCVHTTFAFDPHKESGAAYTWYMPWDWRTLAKLPPVVFDAWKQEYLALLDTDAPDEVSVRKVLRTEVPNQ